MTKKNPTELCYLDGVLVLPNPPGCKYPRDRLCLARKKWTCLCLKLAVTRPVISEYAFGRRRPNGYLLLNLAWA